MTAISELIVYLWLVPVTLFVVLPLTLLLVCSLARAVRSLGRLFSVSGAESLAGEPVRS